MAAESRVIDYMKGLPQSYQHRETYFEQFLEQNSERLVEEIDGPVVEKGLISDGEKEIIRHLNVQDKFTINGFRKSVKICHMVSLGATRQTKRTGTTELDFMGAGPWTLYPSSARALYSSKESTVHLVDEAQRRMIMSKCPTMAGPTSTGTYMAAIHERLSTPSDLRHLFTKMVLYLYDYTLAVVSKDNTMHKADDISFDLRPHLPSDALLATVINHDMVIDGDLFTPEQISLLCLAGQQYPSVWYAGEGNIYNSCNMVADDLVVVSSGRLTTDSAFTWGSPDKLYNMMWTIAQKLNGVSCLMYALESMRGKCKMMSDIVAKTDCREVNAMIPRSYCMSTAFGQIREKQIVVKMPGYFSTSIGMLSDLMYGMTFKAVASCVAETLGAMGTIVSSSTPRTNPTINGLMRDYELQHTNAWDNFMLRNFEMVTRRPTQWDIGQHMKEYALALAEHVMLGYDIEMPSILLTIPALTAVNTAYGLTRGWYGGGSTLDMDKKQRKESTDALCAVGWMCGLRQCRPQVFRNRAGKKQVMANAAERKLKAEAGDDCRIRDVEFWLEDTPGGRVDENEESAPNLYKTEFSGPKCAMVFNYEMGMWIEARQMDYDRLKRETFSGDLTKKERSTMSKVSAMPIHWGPPPNHKAKLEASLEHMKSISRGNAIVPTREPKHVRINSQSMAVVPKYVKDNVEEEKYVHYERPTIEEGDTIRFSEIDVPGDGSCGIHAMVKDLTVHGRLSPNEAAKATELFSTDTASKKFHDAAELAAQCQLWGMGMDLVDKGSNRVTRYGPEDSEYSITIVRDGNHFRAGLIGEGANEMTVEHLEQQTRAPEEFVRDVKSLGSLFGGSPILQ
ncbi:p4 [Penicillium italicum chrysovirus]|nr:p4 [Penicillium italicum chrysovirus]